MNSFLLILQKKIYVANIVVCFMNENIGTQTQTQEIWQQPWSYFNSFTTAPHTSEILSYLQVIYYTVIYAQ